MAFFVSDGTFDIWIYVRSKRDAKLKGSDWTQMPDSPLTDSKKAEWATYRQALRDLPSKHSGETDVTKIVFPTKPS
jgi:hypothetical protein